MGIRIESLKKEINNINGTIKQNLQKEQKSNFWPNMKSISISKVQQNINTIVEDGDWHYDENGKVASEEVNLEEIKRLLEQSDLPELKPQIEKIQGLIDLQQNKNEEKIKDNNKEFESYDSNMNEEPDYENMEFEPYDSNMNGQSGYENIEIEPSEVSQEESKRNKIINAFNLLVAKFKQLTSKKEKVEQEVEKRPNIDKKQIKEDAEKSGRQTIFQRFKGLLARYAIAKKNIVKIEVAMRKRDMDQFISDSKDVAKESITAGKDKIMGEASEIKSEFIDNYNDIKSGIKTGASAVKGVAQKGSQFIKDTAKDVKDEFIDNYNDIKSGVKTGAKAVATGAATAGKATFNGFKTAGGCVIGVGVIAAETISNAAKDVKEAGQAKIQKMVSTGREKANEVLDKLEKNVVEKENLAVTKELEKDSYQPKSFRKNSKTQNKDDGISYE